MLGVMQGCRPNIELAFFGKALSDGSAHAFRINFTHDGILTLMHVFSPDRDSQPSVHHRNIRTKSTTDAKEHRFLYVATLAPLVRDFSSPDGGRSSASPAP